MKKESKTKYVILGLLSISPFSGYEIRKLISNSISHFWAESNGQIYPNLKQLVNDKYIALSSKSSGNKRDQHHYAITSLGHRKLEKWLQSPAEKNNIRDEGLLKLFFGGNVPVEESIRRIRKREESLSNDLEDYHQIKLDIKAKKPSCHQLYWELVLENGISLTEAQLLWCRQSIKRLRGFKK